MKVGINENGIQVDAMKASKKEKYFCPHCRQELKICRGRYKRSYFAHRYTRSDRRQKSKGETKRHLTGKRKITEFFNRHGMKVKTELYLPEIKQRADLEIEINKRIFIIEYQCSPIELADIKKRTEAYFQMGLRSYWIAGPRHIRRGSLFQTVQKFGRFSKKEGWWILTWDALKQEFPQVLFNIQREVLGKIIYQEREFTWGTQRYFSKSRQIGQLPTLEYEARKIERYLLGNQLDQRYLEVQQLCYSNNKNLMGCPWITHFPRVCTDFKNQGVPLLNRVRFLILMEQKAEIQMNDIAKIDSEFWQLLQEKKVVINQAGKWHLVTEKVHWYNSLSEKIATKKIKVFG